MVKEILGAAEALAAKAACLMPPVTADDVHNRLINTLARHSTQFERLHAHTATLVLRRVAIHFANEQRWAHLQTTDHYMYWHPEVRQIIQNYAELQTMDIAAHRLRTYHEWGLPSGKRDYEAAFVAPHFVYSHDLDGIHAISDVLSALRRVSGRAKALRLRDGLQWPVDQICEQLNVHNHACREGSGGY